MERALHLIINNEYLKIGMKKITVEEMLERLVNEFQENGQWGIIRIYRSASRAFSEFSGSGTPIIVRELKPQLLKRFEIFLRQRRCSWNTVSTYMKVLRHVYMQWTEEDSAAFRPHLFRHVFTGTRADRKKALEVQEIGKIIAEAERCLQPGGIPEMNRSQRRALLQFVFMFMMRGLPFVDMAYLRKQDLQDNIISYRRRKTGHPMRMALPEEAVRIMNRLKNKDEDSPYLFSILGSAEGTAEAYKEYQSALRNFNYNLSVLRQSLGIGSELTSYTARHTWATMAYYCEIHPGVISEAMGHSSITVTETYLKPFQERKIDDANRHVLEYVKNGGNYPLPEGQ